MSRHHDWPERLAAYIAARERQRFVWGKRAQDCCSFGAGAVLEITGLDLMAGVPEYFSAEEADLLLGELSIEARLDSHMPRKPASMAQRGDLALATQRGCDTLMIVEGETLVGPGGRGLERLPRTAMRAAWAV